MFTSGGQVDLSFACVVRGGSKGGGGGGAAPQVLPPLVLTDPVNGKTFIQQPGGTLDYNTGQIKYTSAQDELNAEIAQRQAEEKATTAQGKQEAADTKASDLATFNTRKGDAYNNALAAVQRSFQQQGIDPAGYMSTDIQPALQRQLSSIEDLDPNPSAAFPSSLADTIIGNLTSGKRSQATNQLNSLFSPNYSTSMIPDTADDPYIDTILSEQFDPLNAQLTNAQKRGTLTDVGYGAARDVLGQKRSAARDTISSLGQNILATDRSGIDDLISGARSRASNLGLNDAFDPSIYSGQASDKAAGYLGNLGGALRNAVGGTKFADLTELINAGGAVQGANNPTAQNPSGVNPFVDPNDPLNKNRGLGNTGAF